MDGSGFSMGRTIWFVLNQNGANFSETLHDDLKPLISSWEALSAGAGAEVSYLVECSSEESYEKLGERFNNQEFIAVYGVIGSGVMAGERRISWPKRFRQVPKSPAPVQTQIQTQVPKKTLFRTIWDLLRQRHGPKVIR